MVLAVVVLMLIISIVAILDGGPHFTVWWNDDLARQNEIGTKLVQDLVNIAERLDLNLSPDGTLSHCS